MNAVPSLCFTRIEPLEARIAPATLLDASTVVFVDLDGDLATLKFSQPILADLATANALLTFSVGTLDADDTNDAAQPQQLQLINLTSLAGVNADANSGLGFTLTAQRDTVRGGDAFADLGRIDATGLDLGTISVSGDLGVIDAGNPNGAASAIKSLTVGSLGELGLSTGAPNLQSDIDGRVDSFTVKGHVRDARVLVFDSIFTGPTAEDFEASIGALTIGGSIIGGSAANSGEIVVNERIDGVKIAGDIRGGSGTTSGNLQVARGIGAFSLGGSIVGVGDTSGRVLITNGTVGSVFIGGDIRGGTAASGSFQTGVGDPIKSFTMGGSILGGTGTDAGLISLHTVGSVFIGGDVRGGSGAGAGAGRVDFFGDTVGTFTLGGSFVAGVSASSANLVAPNTDFGAIEIGGSIDGTAGATSGQLVIRSADTITLGGSLIGGAAESGKIDASRLGVVHIAGSVLGGSGLNAGSIIAGQKIDAVAIKGSLVGGGGEKSGAIVGDDIIANVTILGDLRGGGGASSGAILAGEKQLGTVLIGGSVHSGGGARSGSITSGDDILSVTVKGSLVGNATQPVLIEADGATTPTATTDVAIGQVVIGGRVERALILAGYRQGAVGNGDAQIGSVTVGGDWIASSIAAGVEDGPDNLFGTADDQTIATGDTLAIASRIGSVTINGQALGTPGGTDAFGIVAEEIGAVKVGAVSETLVADEVDAVPLGATLDFVAREDVVGAEVLLPNLAGSPDSTTVDVVSTTLATWIDVDGDLVTMKTTKPLLDLTDFVFLPGGAGIQVQTIDWTDDNTAANQGVGVTITAQPQDLNGDGIIDGDGSVAIGFINGISGLSMGAVKIAGDLGQIHAGSAANGPIAVKSLVVQSVGLFGLSTQGAGGNLLTSTVGILGSLTVRGEFVGAGFSTGLGGGIGKIQIGGSLRAGDGVEDYGSIDTGGTIGSITIGGDLVGGPDDVSGRIATNFAIGAVKIGGSIIGGGGNFSGQIFGATIKGAKIGRDIRGGGGEASGALDGGFFLGSTTLGGSLVGGGGVESGSLRAEAAATPDFPAGQIKSVKIGGDVRGGIGEESGQIQARQKMGAVTIAGSLVGGGGRHSATIYAGLIGNTSPDTLASVTIGGDVLGGAGTGSAAIGTIFDFTTIPLPLSIGKIAIKGSLVGSNSIETAFILATDIKSVTVGGSVRGGTHNSAAISFNTLASLKIGGSIVAGTGASSGSISVTALGKLTVGRDLLGGPSFFSGSIDIGSGKSITIGGSIGSIPGGKPGGVSSNAPLGALTIKGSVWGTAANSALILARGTAAQTQPLALGKLTIGGSAEYLDLLGGYFSATQPPANADASLGKINVGGTWRAGDIVAGTRPMADGIYGTFDDRPGTLGNGAGKSKIAAIIIKGRALGTIGGTDGFGFSAEEFGAISVGAVKFQLKKGAGNDNLNTVPDELLRVSSTGDFRFTEAAI